MKLTTLVSIVLVSGTMTTQTPSAPAQTQTQIIENHHVELTTENDPYLKYFKKWIPEDSEIYDTTDADDFSFLEHRDGKNVICYEIHTVSNDYTSGDDKNFVSYEGCDVKPNDKVLSVFVYNRDSNDFDDIIDRMDFVIE